MTLHDVLAWSFLFPFLTLMLSASGLPKRAGALSWLAPASIFAVAVAALVTKQVDGADVVFDNWVPFLPDAAFRLHVDALAEVMLLVVGGVATCVYVYSLGYMHDDPRQHRFFAFLDFFVASMVLLVVAGNLGVLLIGWTGVGIASFLLISFWWQKGAPLQAGFLALGANAIGDAALLVAAVLMPKGAGTLANLAHLDLSGVPGGAATIAWCLVIAACAKSAQGPLWWWLPSAMAGPTPVSALIHAATMVAAGVYLLVRTSPLLALDDGVMYNVALVGLLTAIGGGVASLWQSNFKRGLAYSTVSQLGWMFCAIGLGAPFAALFHLVTHAAFKAMLFLSAGTVIAATHHEEEIAKLGGLAKKLPSAHAYFALGTLALIGAPFVTAGAFSKDAIIEGALHSGWSFFAYALLASTILTGAYAGRLFFGVFYGAEGESSKHVHAPGSLFTIPLIPLAIGAIGLGYVEGAGHNLSGLLGATVKTASSPVEIAPNLDGWLAFAGGVVGLGIGFLIARTKTKTLPAPPRMLVDAVGNELRALPDAFGAVHGGRVGRYALIGLVGTALVVYLAQRPVSLQPKGAATAAATKKAILKQQAKPQKPQKAQIGKPTTPLPNPNDDIARKKQLANEKLQKMLGGRSPQELQKAIRDQKLRTEEDAKKRGLPSPAPTIATPPPRTPTPTPTPTPAPGGGQ